MPEDEDNDFDLELEFDLAAEPAPVPEPKRAAPGPPAAAPELPSAAPLPAPGPAPIRKREAARLPPQAPPAQTAPAPQTTPQRRDEPKAQPATRPASPPEPPSEFPNLPPARPRRRVSDRRETPAPADRPALPTTGDHLPPPILEPKQRPAQPKESPPPATTAPPPEAPAPPPMAESVADRFDLPPRTASRPPRRNTRNKPSTQPLAETEFAGRKFVLSQLHKRLLIAIPVALVLIIVASKMFSGGGEPRNRPLDVAAIQAADDNRPPTPPDPPEDPQPEPEADVEVPPDRPLTMDELNESAENTLRNFFAVTKKENLLSYVRDPSRVAPLIKDYYSREPFEINEFLGLKSELQEFEPAGPGFWATEADLGRPGSRTMILEQTPQGFRVDWEYYVRYNPMNWSTFIKEAPADAMDFRVYANIAPDYRHPFTDEQRYIGINMMTLTDTSEVMGYAERASDLGRRLQQLLEGKHEELCILRLQFPSGSKPGDTAVYIRELVNPHWIITDATPGE